MSDLCNPMECSPPVSSVHGIFQVGILEWVAMPSSRGSSWSRDWTRISCIADRFLTAEPSGKCDREAELGRGRSWIGMQLQQRPWGGFSERSQISLPYLTSHCRWLLGRQLYPWARQHPLSQSYFQKEIQLRVISSPLSIQKGGSWWYTTASS